MLLLAHGLRMGHGAAAWRALLCMVLSFLLPLVSVAAVVIDCPCHRPVVTGTTDRQRPTELEAYHRDQCRRARRTVPMRRAEGDPETVGERGLKDVSHSNAAIVYQEPRTLFPVCAEAFWVKLIEGTADRSRVYAVKCA